MSAPEGRAGGRAKKPAHVCEPEQGHIENMVFYSGKSGSWVLVVVPPEQPHRQQRVDVGFCPWCGRDLSEVTVSPEAELLE
jgi:hypothetical protein